MKGPDHIIRLQNLFVVNPEKEVALADAGMGARAAKRYFARDDVSPHLSPEDAVLGLGSPGLDDQNVADRQGDEDRG
jgi:hypothetical protein